jgi:hypothetical protein
MFSGQNNHRYDFYCIARDQVGNIEDPKAVPDAGTRIAVDDIPPSTTVDMSVTPNINGWISENTTISLNAKDNDGGSGVSQLIISATGAQTIPATTIDGSSTSFSITTEGITVVTYFAIDRAGNKEATHSLTVSIDKTAPEAAIQFDPLSSDLMVSGIDSLSGVPRGPIAPTSVVPSLKRDADSDKDDEQKIETRTYTVADRAGNSVVLVLEVRKHAYSIAFRVVSIQYKGGLSSVPPPNAGRFEWGVRHNGSIGALEQRIETGAVGHETEISATFSVARNETAIRVKPRLQHEFVLPGLVLLQLRSENGGLVADF